MNNLEGLKERCGHTVGLHELIRAPRPVTRNVLISEDALVPYILSIY